MGAGMSAWTPVHRPFSPNVSALPDPEAPSLLPRVLSLNQRVKSSLEEEGRKGQATHGRRAHHVQDNTGGCVLRRRGDWPRWTLTWGDEQGPCVRPRLLKGLRLC